MRSSGEGLAGGISEVPTAYPPLSDYALLSDCHSAALVSRDGSVDWCCFHRFDARPVFARLLDWEKGGHFRIAPKGPYTVARRYLPGTNVLETRFQAPRGVLVLVDAMPVRPTSDHSPPEGVHPFHQLIRLVRCEAGEVEVAVEFNPRFEYGLTRPRLEKRAENLAVVYGGPDALVLESSLPLVQTDLCGCGASAVLSEGEEAYVILTYSIPHELRPRLFGADWARRRVSMTGAFWRNWSDRCTYEGPYAEAIQRSALVVKALTNAPSGAIVAAPTTSLPEDVGGARNWDYRYSWLRDAALDLYALFRLGYSEEAHAFMEWVMRTTAGRPEDLQPVYGVGGERLLPENELEGLEGYKGSRPVRVGNGAYRQLQLDVYGELLDTAWLYHRHGGRIDPGFWEFLCGAVDVVERRWTEPDEGIWEVRGGPRHFVYSKVMAWVAVDRAIKLARARRLPAHLERWKTLRKQIRARIETEGVDAETGSFLQAFGSRSADAANLLVPLVRFLPPDDPRVRATLELTEKELLVDGLVYRYRGADGLPGGEGAFVICSFWLVDNLAQTGEVERARELFERLIGYANDVGLLSEQIDPATGDLLGNFPQAFSHVGLIGAAANIERALNADRTRRS